MWCFDVCVISFTTIPHTPSRIFILVCERNTQQWWFPSHHIHHPSSISHNSQQQYNHTSSHIKTHTINHFPHPSVCMCVINPCWLTNGNQSIIHIIQSFLLPIQNYQSINQSMDGWLCVLNVLTVQNNTNTGCDVCVGWLNNKWEMVVCVMEWLFGCVMEWLFVCCGRNEKNGWVVVNVSDWVWVCVPFQSLCPCHCCECTQRDW